MGKVLSIIIPTYNMEEYLPRCLDSVVSIENIDDIEVVVVNDGSKDRSSEIAHSYQSRYPLSVAVIDKENGNYGSTINAALPVVMGKYVKILDADDWFDTDALNTYVKKLRKSESDMIVTPYMIVDKSINRYEIIISGVEENRVYDFESFMNSYSITGGRRIQMFNVAYKREIITSHNYVQTEGISYTDNEWVFYPLYYVNGIEYINITLYHLLRGRTGQTMDAQIRNKNYWQEITITIRMLKEFNIYNSNTPQSVKMLKALINRIKSHYSVVIRGELNDSNLEQLRELYEELKLHPNIKVMAETYTKGSIITTHAVRYFNRRGRRYPNLILWGLNLLNRLRSMLKG